MTAFEYIKVSDLLPQREPFVAIGKLKHFDPITTITLTEIKTTSFFVHDDELTSSGIIENIAQTCAARIGYINKYILKKPIQIGFIGAIRNLDIKCHPKVGEIMETKISIINEVFGMILVSAVSKSEKGIIASGEMKIAIKENS